MTDDILHVIEIPPHTKRHTRGRNLFYSLVPGLRNAYRRYLKPIPWVRYSVIWAFRRAHPCFLRLASWLRSGRSRSVWKPLGHAGRFVDSKALSRLRLVDDAEVKTPVPKVFPSMFQNYIPPQGAYVAPGVYMTPMKNAQVNGGTNLIDVGGRILCHDLFDARRDYTSEELHGRALISVRTSRACWLLEDREPVEVPIAASFVDACAPNYAHWLTEVLPRLALYCAKEEYTTVPIVINSGLHRNILQSVAAFCGSNREIIALPVGRALIAETLHYTSVAGYVPFDRRKRKTLLVGHSQGRFNSHAFQRMRDVLLPGELLTDQQSVFRKIYIRRNSGSRRVTNAVELEAALIQRGFAIVEPEKLSFVQQVQLFANADIVIGSSGAAMANIVFANRSTSIYVLIGRYRETSYWYWQNIASAGGTAIQYVFGEIETDGGDAIHSDFRIDVMGFMRALDEPDREALQSHSRS